VLIRARPAGQSEGTQVQGGHAGAAELGDAQLLRRGVCEGGGVRPVARPRLGTGLRLALGAAESSGGEVGGRVGVFVGGLVCLPASVGRFVDVEAVLDRVVVFEVLEAELERMHRHRPVRPVRPRALLAARLGLASALLEVAALRVRPLRFLRETKVPLFVVFVLFPELLGQQLLRASREGDFLGEEELEQEDFFFDSGELRLVFELAVGVGKDLEDDACLHLAAFEDATGEEDLEQRAFALADEVLQLEGFGERGGLLRRGYLDARPGGFSVPDERHVLQLVVFFPAGGRDREAVHDLLVRFGYPVEVLERLRGGQRHVEASRREVCVGLDERPGGVGEAFDELGAETALAVDEQHEVGFVGAELEAGGLDEQQRDGLGDHGLASGLLEAPYLRESALL